MKIKVTLSSFLIGLILLSTYTAIAIAEPAQNHPTIYMLKKEAVGQVDESRNFTIGHDSKLGEILWESSSSSKEVMVAKTLECYRDKTGVLHGCNLFKYWFNKQRKFSDQ